LHIGLTKATCKTLPFQNPDLEKTGQATARKRTKKPQEDEEVRPTLSHATAVSERLDYQFVDKDGIKNINEVPHRQKIYSKSEILYVSASHYHQGSYNLDTRALVGFYAAYVDISLTMFRENLSIASLRYQYCWTLKDRIFKVPVLLDP